MQLAVFLVLAAKIYAVFGALVAVAFVFSVGRVDPAARGVYLFRPLIMPGVVVLWPVVLWRWRRILQARAACASCAKA